jgi:hypothetical protein
MSCSLLKVYRHLGYFIYWSIMLTYYCVVQYLANYFTLSDISPSGIIPDVRQRCFNRTGWRNTCTGECERNDRYCDPSGSSVVTLQPWIDLNAHNLYTYLRSWALLEKPPIVQPLKNFPAFYGNRRFNTCSQEPSTGPYPDPDGSSPYHPILSL